jgi:acyl-CoA dehydrogenase
MLLFNPKKYTPDHQDKHFQEIMLKTIDFFERKGLQNIKNDDQQKIWYSDFLDFLKKEKILSSLLTPEKYGDGNARWDTWRIAHFNEVLAFYGLAYWYTWQVTILGLGPVWMSANEELKKKAARLLKEGEVFAFGLSEKEHGADIYSTEMQLSAQQNGAYLANGSKYYIGNGNIAKMISTFGKIKDQDEYVFFTVNSLHKNYYLVKNIISSQSYVSEYTLKNYPVKQEDILSKGQEAWDAVLNTVNIGKYNLGCASVGICTHAFYEALNHASKRRLYNLYVTDFPHVKRMFTDSYTRLVAMKLVTLRAADYMRVASADDRRYLLYNPVVKMKVTTQGEEVINLLWDIIAAKGFEKETYFEMAARDIRALPKLEGTVHVNVALILKFMPNFLFRPKNYTDVLQQSHPKDDNFLFKQGTAGGLRKIHFHSYQKAYNSFNLSNIKIFKKQIRLFKLFLLFARPDKSQLKDIDFLFALGEIFTLLVYGQLILENAKIYNLNDDIINRIFDFMVRDFSAFALQLFSKPGLNIRQMYLCRRMIKKPAGNKAQFERIWKNDVFALKEQYTMSD